MTMGFKFINFKELNTKLLYQILYLRQEVFVLEQQCLYADIDNNDEKAIHVICQNKENQLIAYCRIFIDYHSSKIGRVVVKKSERSSGVGKELMISTLNYLQTKNIYNVEIEAQSYLQKFYKNLGFRETSDEFELDGIPHIKMSLVLKH